MMYYTITQKPNARTAVSIPIPAFAPAPSISFGGSVGLPEAEEFGLGCNGIGVVFDASEDIELGDQTADDIREGDEEPDTIEDANSEEFEGGAEKKQFPNALWHPAPQ
jgi:hypothetical protein